MPQIKEKHDSFARNCIVELIREGIERSCRAAEKIMRNDLRTKEQNLSNLLVIKHNSQLNYWKKTDESSLIRIPRNTEK